MSMRLQCILYVHTHLYNVPSKYEILIKVVIGEFGLLSEPLNLIHLKLYLLAHIHVYAMHRRDSPFHFWIGMKWNGTQYVIHCECIQQHFPKNY